MTNFPDFAQQAADAIDALGDSPTPDEARRVTDRYEDTDLLAALVARGGGAGGTAPVSCLLSRDGATNCQTGGSHNLRWDALYDNIYSFNTLTEIPEGLGLTFAFDDTSGTLATTEAGTWSFTMYINRAADDGTWQGFVVIPSGNQHDLQPLAAGANSGNCVVSETVSLPSGFSSTPNVYTLTPTVSTYNVNYVYLGIVRLG